jgi:hypothetical protein
METFLKNKTFEVELTLTYLDNGLPIDLDLLSEITVIIKKTNGGPVLITKKYTLAGVVKKTPASGICSVYINKLDTVNAETGLYDYIVSVEAANANFTGSLSDFAGYGRCFKLVNDSQPL